MTILRTMIVVNECFGGFTLSERAAKELARRKGLLIEKHYDFWVVKGQNRAIDSIVPHDDPDMVSIVQALGPAASGPGSKLVVKKVKVEIIIDNHDGYERVEGAYAVVEPNG